MPDTDLIAFLNACLDEDEAVSPEGWNAKDDVLGMRRVDVDYSIERVVACTLAWRGEHIARHDPARVLREVEAKRQIINLHRRQSELDYDPICNVCCYTPPCETLRTLALPYSDREGYQERWRL